DDLAGREALQLHAVTKAIDKVLGKRCKNGNALQMCFQSAGTVVLLELSAECLVLLQNVEYVAQHLQTDRIFRRTDRSAARVEAHAGHLAEEIACLKLRDWMVILQIDGRIDVDVLALGVFLLALVLLAWLRSEEHTS